MATWMQEFKALQTPAVRGAPSKRLPPSKAEQIEAELKLLEWHRLANNAAIKVLLTAVSASCLHSSCEGFDAEDQVPAAGRGQDQR